MSRVRLRIRLRRFFSAEGCGATSGTIAFAATGFLNGAGCDTAGLTTGFAASGFRRDCFRGRWRARFGSLRGGGLCTGLADGGGCLGCVSRAAGLPLEAGFDGTGACTSRLSYCVAGLASEGAGRGRRAGRSQWQARLLDAGAETFRCGSRGAAFGQGRARLPMSAGLAGGNVLIGDLEQFGGELWLRFPTGSPASPEGWALRR